MIDEATIKKRITELTADRDRYIAEANAHVTGFNAAIAELQNLITPVPGPQELQDVPIKAL